MSSVSVSFFVNLLAIKDQKKKIATIFSSTCAGKDAKMIWNDIFLTVLSRFGRRGWTICNAKKKRRGSPPVHTPKTCAEVFGGSLSIPILFERHKQFPVYINAPIRFFNRKSTAEVIDDYKFGKNFLLLSEQMRRCTAEKKRIKNESSVSYKKKERKIIKINRNSLHFEKLGNLFFPPQTKIVGFVVVLEILHYFNLFVFFQIFAY